MAGVLWQLRKCLAPRWRQRLKREILLRRPSLHALDSIRYEQSLPPDELRALLAKLDAVLDVPGDVIDCDLHDSMLYAARTVWPRLAPGDCCIFDDYDNDHFRGATKAIDTFIAEQTGSIRDHGQLLGKLYFAGK